MNKKAALIVLLFVAGCKPDVAWMDKRDAEEPLMKRAAMKVDEGDIASAVRLYTKALEENPGAVRGHLDVALLLDDYQKDYVRAIYHYRRYLELRTEAEKRAMIEERIRRAEQMFAAGVLMPSSQADRVASLERENRVLKSNIQKLNRRLSQLQVVANRRPSGGTSGSSAEDSRPRTYTVQSGDFLTRISEKVYGDPNRWREIHEANRDKLGPSTNVKPGQVLVIP